MQESTYTDVVQTIAIVAGLWFTAREMRARAREQKFRNYLDSISGFLNLSTLMIEKGDLHSLYDYSPVDLDRDYEELTPAERTRVHFCDTVIALCETVWYAREEGWMPTDEWEYWRSWARQLHGSPYFRWTLKWVKEDYDAGFLETLEPAQKRAFSGSVLA